VQRQAFGPPQQVSKVARATSVLVSQLSWSGHSCFSQELPAGGCDTTCRGSPNPIPASPSASAGSRQGHTAVWEGCQGHVHHGLPLPAVSLPSVRDLPEQLRHQAGLRIKSASCACIAHRCFSEIKVAASPQVHLGMPFYCRWCCAALLTQKQPQKCMGLFQQNTLLITCSCCYFPSDAVACCTAFPFLFSSVACPVTITLYAYLDDSSVLHWIVHQDGINRDSYNNPIFWGWVSVFVASAVSTSGE
jgi:hypothetical protein